VPYRGSPSPSYRQHRCGDVACRALAGPLHRDFVDNALASASHRNPLVFVHVLGFSTDVCLVNFDRARHLCERLRKHCFTNAVEHEPRRLLRDKKRPSQFVTRNTVLAIGDQPHGGEPLVETDRGILKDGTDLDRELLFATLAPPNTAVFIERHMPVTASRARNRTIRPAQFHNKPKGYVGVRKVADRLKKAAGLGRCACPISIVCSCCAPKECVCQVYQSHDYAEVCILMR
jgi:hypothetical protein